MLEPLHEIGADNSIIVNADSAEVETSHIFKFSLRYSGGLLYLYGSSGQARNEWVSSINRSREMLL